MSLIKSYAIFGLGRYGYSVATELIKSGVDVLAIDYDESRVNYASNEIPLCKCADATDMDVLKKLGISNFDTVIIAMGSNIEASVMSVMLCKELGVKTVIAKSSNDFHSKILSKVGADKIVFPEKDSGIRLAKNLLSSGFIDVIELGNNIAMIELNVKEEWLGKNLLELNLRKKYSLNVIGVKENNEINIEIDPTLPLNENMKLIVVGNIIKISKLNS